MIYARQPSRSGLSDLPGTYQTRARVNMTMHAALSRVGLIDAAGARGNLLVAESATEATDSCPDGAWCKDRDEQGRLSIRRFCAQPFICPVRSHHTRYHIPSTPKNHGGAPRSLGARVMAAAVVAIIYSSCLFDELLSSC